MSPTVVAALVAALCLVVLPWSLRSWTGLDHSPRAGLVLWGGLCVVGWLAAVVSFLGVGLGSPHQPILRALVVFVEQLGDGHPLRGLGLSEVVGLSVAFDIVIVMSGALVVTAARVWRVRDQQRSVLDLVAEPRADDGLCLLRHEYPMAYFLPGDGGRVVVSTGAVDLLSDDELRAVVAHENGHRHGRHGSVLVPLQVLASFVSFLPLARYAPTAIRTYLEMSADDYSRSREPTDSLRNALSKASLFRPPPVGALNIATGLIERRISRLDASPRRAVGAAALALSTTATLLAATLLVAVR